MAGARPSPMGASGKRAVDRCDHLGVAPYSDMEGGLYRAWLTPAHRHALHALTGWMEEAGMTVRLDPMGNLVGHYAGQAAQAPVLLTGSHIDSVRDGGRYDGALGIMLGIECVAALHAAGRRLPFAIEVVAFGDEEGSRFPAAMLTSRAMAGMFDPAALHLADARGETIAQAMAGFGLDPALAAQARIVRPPIAFFEAHIEQGQVLEAEGLAIGTVTGIAAQSRYRVVVTGRAAHAGTTPMHLRADALAGAAEMVLAIEAIAGADEGDLVGTVGALQPEPGAVNVIAGKVAFSIDVRAGSPARRDAGAGAMLAAIAAIAGARGLEAVVSCLHQHEASPCDAALMDLLDRAIAGQGAPVRRLVSGAGHDAAIIAALCPTAMLFIRSPGGVSHNPAETVGVDDVELALNTMLSFLELLADGHGCGTAPEKMMLKSGENGA